jgi:beta-phosphoglucomutase family hydrolase
MSAKPQEPPVRITPERFDAVLFDLDGVLTATAQVHARAWKRMFDEFLGRRAKARGEPFRPFDAGSDYLQYVDGKPRYDGVRSFLASRGIALPEGDAQDPPEAETVCGLGNRKNALVSQALATETIEPYPGSVAFAEQVRRRGIRTAVVSSSHNCQAVLRAAGIEHLFDTRVDGQAAVQMGLAGKPAPDTYLKAAELLRAPPQRAVVVEDAISGVQAGRSGGFGLVVGVARSGDPAALASNGADVVVADLGELLEP